MMYHLVLVIMIAGSIVTAGYCCDEGIVEFPSIAACEERLKVEEARLGPELAKELATAEEFNGMEPGTITYKFECQALTLEHQEAPDADESI